MICEKAVVKLVDASLEFLKPSLELLKIMMMTIWMMNSLFIFVFKKCEKNYEKANSMM